MKSHPYGIMKRSYIDGQYTIIRKSPWLMTVIIEGPLGERAGNSFITWLDDLYHLYGATQYILLNVSNIGPINLNVLQQLVGVFLKEEIGGLAIFGNAIAQQSLRTLLDLTPDHQRIKFCNNEKESLKFLEYLYLETNP